MGLPPIDFRLSVGASSAAASGLTHAGRRSPRTTLARTKPANRRARRNEVHYRAPPANAQDEAGVKKIRALSHASPHSKARSTRPGPADRPIFGVQPRAPRA